MFYNHLPRNRLLTRAAYSQEMRVHCAVHPSCRGSKKEERYDERYGIGVGTRNFVSRATLCNFQNMTRGQYE